MTTTVNISNNKCLVIMAFISLFLSISITSNAAPADDTPVKFWLESSLKRIFPKSPAGGNTLELLSARNARIAFQVGFRNTTSNMQQVSCSLTGADVYKPRVRFVGLVPMYHFTPNTNADELDGIDYLPGLNPDPLYLLNNVESAPMESRSFWVTLNIPADAAPGMHEFKVRLTYDNGKKEIFLPVKIYVSKLVIQPRKNFDVIHWWRGEVTWDYYKTEMFDERWWALTKDQVKNMLDHGSNVIYVPVFFDRKEEFKRPCQLLIVDEPQKGKYRFNWSLVKRFVDMSKATGVTKFEWSHFWTYWGVKNPARVYTKKNGKYVMLWDPEIGATSDTYVNFLKQFLPELHTFLKKENILESSYFHLSDEPGMVTNELGADQHIANYKAARNVLKKYAPWMKVMDALSDIQYGRQGLTDIPIPIVDAAQNYINEKIPHWVYFCCGPRGPWINRFMDTPLPKVRMAGWLFYKFRAEGFLHWGYNYWHKNAREEMADPFTNGSTSGYPGLPFGDPFVVYPGKDEVLDSIRWEVFAESLQDYAILQSAGINPDDLLLGDIKTYANFPKQEDWIKSKLEKILKTQ